MMKSDHPTVLVEAVLFLENEPVDTAVIARITGLNRREVLDAVENCASCTPGTITAWKL